MTGWEPARRWRRRSPRPRHARRRPFDWTGQFFICGLVTGLDPGQNGRKVPSPCLSPGPASKRPSPPQRQPALEADRPQEETTTRAPAHPRIAGLAGVVHARQHGGFNVSRQVAGAEHGDGAGRPAERQHDLLEVSSNDLRYGCSCPLGTGKRRGLSVDRAGAFILRGPRHLHADRPARHTIDFEEPGSSGPRFRTDGH